MMKDGTRPKSFPNHIFKTASLLAITCSMSWLVACQGFGAGGTGQQPGSTLSLASGSLDFGSVKTGATKTLTVNATNSGPDAVTISGASISEKHFTLTSPGIPATIAAGQSIALGVKFSPNASGAFSGVVTLASDATNASASLSVSGTGTSGGQLTSYPASQAFGSVSVGGKQTQTVTLTNTGGTTVNISSVTISGAGFQLSGITPPVSLTGSQSTTFTLTFAPQAAGNASGTVTITSDASNPTLTISLTGTGIAAGALAASPSNLAYGSVTVGGTKSLLDTVKNAGATAITISQVVISGAGFSLSGMTAPVTVQAGQSAGLTITFSPQAAGTASGSVTLTSDAPNPTLTIPLAATGVTPGALGSNPTSLAFGNVTLGSNKSLSETVTNTGGTSVTISQVGTTGTGFSVSGIATPATLTAGQAATFTVAFSPQAAGAANGSVTLTSNASNATLTIPVSGTGVTAGALGSNPTSLAFGSVTVGGKQTLSETVTNTGGASVTISQVGASGTGFSLSGITAPVTLAAGQSASFSVSFSPQSAGATSGNVTLSSNASNPTLTIPLSGTGTAATGQLAVTPATMDLGSVAVGSSASGNGTLTASGANVTVTAASTNNSVFTVGSLSLPVTIPAGQSTSFRVTFSPQAAGAASAALTFTSNANPSSTTETLKGTGTSTNPGTHSVDLSWNASTSSNVSGYNVYRATYTNSACGSFSKINSVLDTTTLYTDSSVVNGIIYCYATTAVDSSSQESGYSNIVSNVQIPAS